MPERRQRVRFRGCEWKSGASRLSGVRLTPYAEQGARANADICHAACDLMGFEMKKGNPVPIEARGAPDAVVAHL